MTEKKMNALATGLRGGKKVVVGLVSPWYESLDCEAKEAFWDRILCSDNKCDLAGIMQSIDEDYP